MYKSLTDATPGGPTATPTPTPTLSPTVSPTPTPTDAPIFYSVGQSPLDHSSGGNVTILGGEATFTTPQIAPNIGVGDRLTAGGNIYYLASKTSTTVWRVITKRGATPPDLAPTAVTSITHEYLSLAAAIAGASDPNHLNTSDLVAGHFILNFPCYFDFGPDTALVTVAGYTTNADNSIRIYTPYDTLTEVNQSQRHTGKWNDLKYHLLGANGVALQINQSDVVVEGLQVGLSAINDMNQKGIQIGAANPRVRISNNIVRGTATFPSQIWHAGIVQYGASGTGTTKIYNNIVYNWGLGIEIYDGGTTIVSSIYNNTVVDCTVGFYLGSTVPAHSAINNLSYNNVTNWMGEGGGNPWTGDYNISGPTLSGAPGVHSRNAVAIDFKDFAGKDFRLDHTDAVAKRTGANLSADASLAFATDIEGESRSSAWDIGADQSLENSVYYSVGQDTLNHSSGGNVVISSGMATFSVPQVATNLGAGDRLTAGGNTYYLSSKVSSTVWRVVTKLGTIPADLPSTPVTSIAHEYSSLAAAESGASDANHLNTSDLTAGRFVLNFPCYFDTSADTTAVIIDDWTTGPNNFIKIYTPAWATESNVSQRHSGKWDTTKYHLVTTNQASITQKESYVKILGLQIHSSSVNSTNQGTVLGRMSDAGSSEITVAFNILRGPGDAGGTQYIDGYQVYFITPTSVSKVFNNIIYDFANTTNGGGITNWDVDNTTYAYNNTIWNCNMGIHTDFSTSTIAKNNLISGAIAAWGTFAAGTDYNATDSGTMNYTVTGGGNTHDKISQTFLFADAAGRDFRLDPSDTAAKNAGTDLGSNSSLALYNDIDGHIRSGAWDIGADETSENNVNYSVGQNTLNHSSGGSVTITSGIASFSVPQVAPNLGVGDRLTAGGNAYYLASKISTTAWRVVTKLGAAPADLAYTAVTSIAHEYTSLSAAEAGASDIDHLNSADLVSRNVVLNFPCFFDTGPDTTATTIDGWTTGPKNYIRIYTPTNASTEVNASQRHGGQWDDTKFNIKLATGDPILVRSDNVRIQGLQIDIYNATTESEGIHFYGATGVCDYEASHNIIRGTIGGNTAEVHGIVVWNAGTAGSVSKVFNNIVYNFRTGNTSYVDGLAFWDPDFIHYVYNNTIYNCDVGIDQGLGSTIVLKNNVVQNSRIGYDGSWHASSDYNLSDLAGDAPGANAKNLTAVTFVNTGTEDFHLAPADLGAKDAGTNLSSDSALPFTSDVDNQTRSGTWDIGADEI